MADDTTTEVESSILDTQVNNDSTEQRNEEADAGGEVTEMDSKFMTKTNQRMADSDKLNALLLRGLTSQEIQEQEPELVTRLKRNKAYADVFDEEVSEATEQSEAKDTFEHDKHLAITSLTVQGKRLGVADVKQLKDNKEFNKRYNALVKGGYEPHDAVNEAFSKAYPQFAEKAESILLSGQGTPEVKPKANLTEKERKLLKSFGSSEEKYAERHGYAV